MRKMIEVKRKRPGMRVKTTLKAGAVKKKKVAK